MEETQLAAKNPKKTKKKQNKNQKRKQRNKHMSRENGGLLSFLHF